jgi:cytochrome c peroxidase
MLVEVLIALAIPLGLDLYLPVPEDNPMTAEKVELGRQLFFDRRLSHDGSLSCASCHQPDRAFTDGRVVAVGVGGRQGRRNSPALINRGYGRAFFWDARSASLEDQVVKPIEDPNELGSSLHEASGRVGVSVSGMIQALSSFVRSVLSGNSPFDRFINGDVTALTTDQQAGLRLFRGRGNCSACHVGPTLTDERTHNTGVAWRDGALVDRGASRGDFKTPTLREVARTAPYMHDGSLRTLESVVDFYDGGGRTNPSLDPEILPLRLTDDEKRQLVSFLHALSGDVSYGRGSVR